IELPANTAEMSMPRSAATCRPTTASRPTVPHPMICPIATTTSTPMMLLPGFNDRVLSSQAGSDPASDVLPGHDEQHRGPFIVEAHDVAGLDLQRSPVAGTRILFTQPVRRRVIVVAVERVASLGLAGL